MLALNVFFPPAVVRDNFLLIVDRVHGILQLDMSTEQLHGIDLRPLQLIAPVAVVYDHVAEKIYWSDVNTETINVASLSGSDAAVLLHTGVGE